MRASCPSPSQGSPRLPCSSTSRCSTGRAPLPRNLQEALDLFENSPLMRDALGEHIHSFFLRKKRAEWEKYTSIVTEWEVQQYLASS